MHGTSKFVKLFFIFGVKKWTRRWGKNIRCTCSHESILCRPESYFPSDIHLGGVTLSVMLHTSLYVQCYFNKAKNKKKGGGRGNKKAKEKNQQKKIRPSQTRSISIITYDIHKWWKFSKFCFNLNRTRYAGARGTTTNKIRDSFKFFEWEQETHSFISISCYWYIRWCSEEQ